MPPYILFVLTACLLYSIQNVIISRHLSTLSEWLLLACAHIVSVTLAWGIILTRHRTGMELALPDGWKPWALLAVIAMFNTGADYCFFRAYTAGGNMTVITTLVVTLPVFATIINFATGGGLPSWRHIVAWALVATAVWLVSNGKSVPTP